MNRMLKYSRLFMAIVLVTGLVSSVGCEPLRKKFTRKKKDREQTRDIPVLEPIDYPEKIEQPLDILKQSYSMWLLWYGQWTTDMAETSTDKRLIYDLNQLVTLVDELQPVFAETRQALLQDYSRRLAKVRGEFDKPAALRNASYMRSDMRRIDKDFRANFKPEIAQEFLKK